MSDATSTIFLKLLSSGDLTALVRGKEHSESLKLSLEGLNRGLQLIGGGLTFTAALAGIKNSIEFGSAIRDLSIQAGISANAFQKLSYAGIDYGLSQEDLSNTLNTLQKNMAEAADGASKQNRAIADLGLNTAELLAMPMEEQIEAIAKAYVNASDKGKAWANVIDLIGKSAAKSKEMLLEMGSHKLETPFFTITNEELKRVDDLGDFWAKVGRNIKAIGTIAVSGKANNWLDPFAAAGHAAMNNGATSLNLPKEIAAGAEAAPTPRDDLVAKKEADLVETIRTKPQMVAASQALAKALLDEGKAYETAAEAAKRLRAEADGDMERANKLAENKFDPEAQLEAVKLRTEAAKLRTQANAAEAKDAKEKAQYDSADAEMAMRKAQQATKLLPIQAQLAQAREHEASVTKELGTLDEKSLTFRADRLKLEGQLLAVKTAIAALEERGAAQMVDQVAKDNDLKNRSASIALAAIEYDYNLTDTQKWEQKRVILQRAVAEQEKYVANMQAIANDASQPQGARDKAGNAAAMGQSGVDSMRGEIGAMGPDPQSFTQNFSKGINDLRDQWGTFQQQMASGLTGQISAAVGTVSRGINGWLTGAMTFKQGLGSIWSGFAQSATQAFADMLAKYAINKAMMFAIDQAMAAKGLLLSAASAAKSLVMWIPSAIAASISSWGLAAAIGTAAVIGILASGGFEDGGYTGGREGQAVGIVHGEEFVWSAPAVRAIGAGNLERAHQAALGGGGSGTSAGGGASGGPITLINAMSPEDVARSQRRYVGAIVQKSVGTIPTTRFRM